MKIRKTVLALAVILNVLVGCSSKHDHHEETADSNAEEWPEMDSFHMIMAETFHPYKDSANLKPVKDHAEELKVKAIKWADATIPSRVDNETVHKDLLTLQSKAILLAELVKTGNDQEIAASLTELHDLFHKIMEAWHSKEGEEHERKHEHEDENH
jgi:PBP1b-binding outer membrane lipoprotein LpoB